MSNNDLVNNRRARYDYEILETYEAGIVLTGTEVKSLRQNGGSLNEAYVRVINSELWLVGAGIAPYNFGNVYNHKEKRDRKLLMSRREIDKLHSSTKLMGYTLVPLSIYLKHGLIKVRIATAKGKKNVDKRDAIMERDSKRRVDRMIKSFNN